MDWFYSWFTSDVKPPPGFLEELQQVQARRKIRERAEQRYDKTEMIRQVRLFLDFVEAAPKRSDKMALAYQLFDLLASDQGRAFTHDHAVFSGVVLAKLDELQQEGMDLAWHRWRIFPETRLSSAGRSSASLGRTAV